MACRRATGLARQATVSYVARVRRVDRIFGSDEIWHQQWRHRVDRNFVSEEMSHRRWRKMGLRSGPGESTLHGNASMTEGLPRLTSKQDVPIPKPFGGLQFLRAYATDLPSHQEIGMPSLSPTMTQGNVVKWKKREGDQVAAGDVLCEIETDKSTLEMESMDEGYLAKIIVGDGSKDIQVGQPICIVVENKDDIGKFSDYSRLGGIPKQEASTPPSSRARPPPPPQRPSKPASPPSSVDRVFASPAAKKLASEKNVPLPSIKGTGPHGHIVKADVEDYLGSGGFAATRKETPVGGASAQVPVGGGPTYVDIPYNEVKRATAQQLLQSKQTIPHYYLSLDTRVDSLLVLQEQFNQVQESSKRNNLSLNDFVIKAAALALKKVPECNSSWTDDFIRQYHNVNIGVAVNTEEGFVIPVVIKDADKRGLSDISLDVNNLKEKARTNSLKPSDYEGGTFTISNVGEAFEIRQFSAIVNPSQSCVLAVGSMEKRLIPGHEKGEFIPGAFMTVTLSCDHRVVDGAVGAQWLGAFKGYIEEPMMLLL